MSADEINELRILIAQLGGELKSVYELVKSIKDCQERERNKAETNSNKIAVIEQKINELEKDVQNNFLQHKEFYESNGYLKSVKGALAIMQWLIGLLGLGGVAALIKVFSL